MSWNGSLPSALVFSDIIFLPHLGAIIFPQSPKPSPVASCEERNTTVQLTVSVLAANLKDSIEPCSGPSPAN